MGGAVEFLVKRQRDIKNDERPESINNKVKRHDERPEPMNNNKHSKTEFDAKNKSNNMLTNSINQIFQLRCSTTCVNKYNYVQPRSDTTPLYHVSVTNPLYQGGVLLHKLYSENEELCPSPSLSSNDNKFGYISEILPTLTASQILLLFSIKGVRLLTVPRHILSPHCAYQIASPIYEANVPFPIFVQPRCDTILLYHISVTNPLYQGGVLLNKFYGKILSYHMNILWY